MESGIHIQQLIFSDCTEEQLLFLKQMGIQYVCALFLDEHCDYDSVMKFAERVRNHGLILTDAGNKTIYKNAAIHLGLPGRDKAIERYNDFSKILARAGIFVNYMTWEPNGVLTTRYGVGEYTRGGVARLVDVKQLETLPYSHGRFFEKEEQWVKFRYFFVHVVKGIFVLVV